MRSVSIFLSTVLATSVAGQITEGKGGGSIVSPYSRDDTGGSGPYKAKYWPKADPSLPDHTIYAPISPPKDISMPLIVWGEGACAYQGTAFVNLLTELASHGYVVLANGTPGTPGSPGAGGKSTSAAMLTTAMNWVRDGKDQGKYGNIDKDRVVAAGQSCGGGQAMTVSGDPRVKLTGMFNSGGMGGQISKLNHPVMYLLGGKGDIAFSKGMAEYRSLPKNVPAIALSMDGAGHGGSYGEKQAGKFGKAAVAIFNYVMKNDEKAKALLFPGDAFKRDGWEIESKNWDNFKPS